MEERKTFYLQLHTQIRQGTRTEATLPVVGYVVYFTIISISFQYIYKITSKLHKKLILK